MIDTTCQTPVAIEHSKRDDVIASCEKRSLQDPPTDDESWSCSSSSDVDTQHVVEQQSQNKQVRFATTNTGIVETHHAPSTFDDCDLDKQRLWWTVEEQMDSTEHSRSLVRKFKDEYMDQVEHFVNVFDECGKTLCKPSSDSCCDFELDSTASLTVPAMVRGLETGTVPSILEQRRKHVKTVLVAQNQMSGRLNPDLRYRVLGSRAMKSSRPSRVVARLLGEGDAAAVTAQHVDDV